MDSLILVPHRWVPYVTFVFGLLALLMAGWPYAYGVYSESLKETLDYSQTEVNLIPAIGNNGVYFGGILAGGLLPVLGIFWNQILAGALMAGGQLLMALTYGGVLPFKHVGFMTTYYTLACLGAAFGLLGPLNTVAFNAPVEKKGIVLGFLMAAFGLSALALTEFSGWLFPGDALSFFYFGSSYAAFAFGSSAFFVRKAERSPLEGSNGTASQPVEEVGRLAGGVGAEEEEADEERGGYEAMREEEEDAAAKEEREKGRWFDIGTRQFLLTYLMFAAVTGPGLMFINSVASMGRSLFGPVGDESVAEWERYKTGLVSTLSLCNFLGRVLMGLASDGALHFFAIPRRVCILVAVSCMTFAQLLPILFVSKGPLFFATVVTGLSYGATFSIYASFLSDAFGSKNYALNWGVTTTAAGVMGTVCGIIFGRVYDSQADQEGYCYGAGCYRAAFLITFGLLVVLGIAPGILLMIGGVRNGRWIGGGKLGGRRVGVEEGGERSRGGRGGVYRPPEFRGAAVVGGKEVEDEEEDRMRESGSFKNQEGEGELSVPSKRMRSNATVSTAG